MLPLSAVSVARLFTLSRITIVSVALLFLVLMFRHASIGVIDDFKNSLPSLAYFQCTRVTKFLASPESIAHFMASIARKVHKLNVF